MDVGAMDRVGQPRPNWEAWREERREKGHYYFSDGGGKLLG